MGIMEFLKDALDLAKKLSSKKPLKYCLRKHLPMAREILSGGDRLNSKPTE